MRRSPISASARAWDLRPCLTDRERRALGVRNLGELIGKRARLQGFVVFDYANRYPEAHHWLATQNKAGRLHQRMHVLEDLGRAPEGLGMLFRGENLGKLAVQVSAPAAS